MNVVPQALRTIMIDQRVNSEVYVQVLSEPMKFLQSVSSSKETGDCSRQRRKSLTSAGIETTTSGFDRPLLYRLSYEARRGSLWW